jgi:hypothetical protein
MPRHHHDPDQLHPSPAIAPSLLRMSALQRLTGAVVVAAVLGLAVWWAMA